LRKKNEQKRVKKRVKNAYDHFFKIFDSGDTLIIRKFERMGTSKSLGTPLYNMGSNMQKKN
jgi:hypothetical protein